MKEKEKKLIALSLSLRCFTGTGRKFFIYVERQIFILSYRDRCPVPPKKISGLLILQADSIFNFIQINCYLIIMFTSYLMKLFISDGMSSSSVSTETKSDDYVKSSTNKN